MGAGGRYACYDDASSFDTPAVAVLRLPPPSSPYPTVPLSSPCQFSPPPSLHVIIMQSAVTESWPGWASLKFGLEMQRPYAEYLLAGRKTIETRSYALPQPLVTKNDGSSAEIHIDILESESGKDGVSSIPDQVKVLKRQQLQDEDQPSGPFVVRKGWCTFVESYRYTSREQFEADEHKHLVPSSSGYAWDDNRPLYGWVVGTCGYFDDDDCNGTYSAERRMRSLFEIIQKS